MSSAAPALPASVGAVREESATLAVPFFHHPFWTAAFPWLVQGITGGGDPARPFDLGLFGAVPAGAAAERWRALRAALGLATAVHARQVHGARVLVHGSCAAGLVVADDADGHATAAPDTLLTVSVADCVPIHIVDAERRVVALLHGGWRGVAAGIVEHGLDALRRGWGTPPDAVHAHLGPAICGACYEVGGEVLAALGLPGTRPAQLDLRALIARRLTQRGVPAARITASEHCTRCGGAGFFSHRGGSSARQLAVLGIRA